MSKFLNLMQSKGDQVLLIDGKRSFTLKQFLRQALLLSEEIDSAPGERVTLCCNDSGILQAAMFAVWMRRSLAVPVNPGFPDAEIHRRMQQAGSTLLLTENNNKELQCEEIRILRLPGSLSTFTDAFPNFLKELQDRQDKEANKQPENPNKNLVHPVIMSNFFKISPENAMPQLDPEAPSTVLFTSGSSGTPKACVLSLKNLWTSASGANERMPLVPGDRWLLSLPLYHVGGLGIVFRTLISGAAMVLRRSETGLPEQLQNDGITHLSLVPAQLQRLLSSQPGREALSGLKLILLGGSSIPDPLLEESMRLNLPVMTTYGCTEMASQVATGKPIKEGETFVPAGEVLPHREVRITDEGEILVRGNTRFLGYLVPSERSGKDSALQLHQPFDPGGWYATGDIGRWSSESDHPLLIVEGRQDTLFVSGGENIHPEEIEAQLMRYPGIADSLVVPVADPEFVARPVAFLAITPGMEFLEETALRDFLKKSLAGFQVPDLFLLLPETGIDFKPRRKALSAKAQPVYEEWRREKPLRKWLLHQPPGWNRVLLHEGKPVFLTRHHGPTHIQYVYIRANNRHEVMQWFLSKKNRGLIFSDTSPLLWKHDENQDGLSRDHDPLEIIRLLQSDSYDSAMTVYGIGEQGKIHEYRLDPPSLFAQGFPWEIHSFSGEISKHPHGIEYGFCAPGFPGHPPDSMHQHVFQCGIRLSEFDRIYLIRCLYDCSIQPLRFLGWKVQKLREQRSGLERDHPIWEMSETEEKALEHVLLIQGLISSEDLKGANTPALDRKRRRHFANAL